MIQLKAKLQKVIVTQSDENYIGSITIDRELMTYLGVEPYEMCIINGKENRDNITYVIPGESGSGIIAINGALSSKHKKGDKIHVLFQDVVDMPKEPNIVVTDENNKFVKYL